MNLLSQGPSMLRFSALGASGRLLQMETAVIRKHLETNSFRQEQMNIQLSFVDDEKESIRHYPVDWQ